MLEAEPPLPDRRLLRAARSLFTNRERLAVIERRIESASDEIARYLGLWGLESATFGVYHVVLDDGFLTLTRHVLQEAVQLSLPGLASSTAIEPQSVEEGRP